MSPAQPPLRTLQQLAHTLRQRGDAIAVEAVGMDDIVAWSYADLSGYADDCAQGLALRGIGLGNAVAILARPSPQWIAACIGVLKAGAVVVPLDTQFADDVLTHVVVDCGARCVFTTREQQNRLAQLTSLTKPRIVALEDLPTTSRGGASHIQAVQRGIAEAGEDDVAAIFYTSGTTGLPKGVELTHRNLAFQLNAMAESGIVRPGMRVLLPLPLHHVYPFVMGILAPLSLGIRIVLPQALGGPMILRAAQLGQVDVLVGVPRLYEMLLASVRGRVDAAGPFLRHSFRWSLSTSRWFRRRLGIRLGKILFAPVHRRIAPRLDVLACGGAALDERLAWDLEAMGWHVAEGYGLTETAPVISMNTPKIKKIGSVGRPVPGVQVRIDRAAGAAEGEILTRGPHVFKAYKNLSAKTKEAFTDGGWFRTGDLGYLDKDAFLHVTGRVSTLIVTAGGENVQPEVVEHAYERCPLIKEAGVLERDGRLVAVLVPDNRSMDAMGRPNFEAALRERLATLAQGLPSYQRISDYLLSRDALARTRLGKIQRHLLEERYDALKSGASLPATALEGPLPFEEMSDRDRELLEVEPVQRLWTMLADRFSGKRITPDSHFQLDLAVDSLEWLDLTVRIQECSGVELDEKAIARIRIVRDLLTEVSEGVRGELEARVSSILGDPERNLTEEQKRRLAPLSPAMTRAAHAIHRLDRFLANRCFRLRVFGVEYLPKQRPVVIVPNHCSYLDPFVLAASLNFEFIKNACWAAYQPIMQANPLNRFVGRIARTLPVDPDRARLSSLQLAAAALRRGNSLVWFPEGQRSKTGDLLPFRYGIGELLAHVPTPVVPVFIGGTHEAYPPGKVFPRFKPVTVVFGEPVDVPRILESGSLTNPREELTQLLFGSVAELGRRHPSSR